MIHGMGAGVGLWAMNLESIAKSRPVYAFDLLGFGRSSRVKFPKDPMLAEMEFVEAIEDMEKADEGNLYTMKRKQLKSLTQIDIVYYNFYLIKNSKVGSNQ